MFEEINLEENNNYEKWCEEWRKKFLKLNQEELKKKLPELEEEGYRTICGSFPEGDHEPFSRMFDGYTKELAEACEKLGGTRLSWSDTGYELKAFECIPVRFLFWEGDEEFPAQGNILFDASATDFIHGESIVTIAVIGLMRLANLAAIEMDRSTFPIF